MNKFGHRGETGLQKTPFLRDKHDKAWLEFAEMHLDKSQCFWETTFKERNIALNMKYNRGSSKDCFECVKGSVKSDQREKHAPQSSDPINDCGNMNQNISVKGSKNWWVMNRLSKWLAIHPDLKMHKMKRSTLRIVVVHWKTTTASVNGYFISLFVSYIKNAKCCTVTFQINFF